MTGSSRGFLEQVASPRFCERLFAHLPDVVFCLKDAQRRYQSANPAFTARLGLRDARRLIGRTAEEFFPEHLAMVYRQQDLQLLATTRQPISEIALDCGYGDQTAFSRQFRAAVGMPPAAYRDHSLKHE